MKDTQQRGVKQPREVLKPAIFSVAMIGVALLIFRISGNHYFQVAPFSDPRMKSFVSYQLNMLPVCALALLVTYLFAGRVRLSYFNLQRKGELKPFFMQKEGGRWETDGWYIGAIMMAIVAAVTYFQFAPGGFSFHWFAILMVVPLAAWNAFTEEVIFRLPFVTMGANSTNSSVYGLVMGSLVFGVFHYFGAAPNGFVGAVMSAITGYVLAKSMQETKGFFWAFMIHLMLDVAVFFWAFNQAL